MMEWKKVVLCNVCVGMLGVGGHAWAEVVARPLLPVSGTGNEAHRFTKLDPAATGLASSLKMDNEHRQAYLYHSSMSAGGLAVGDVTGDGMPDVFVSRGALTPQLFVQQESLVFANTSDALGDKGKEAVWTTGPAMVDIDGDGDLDVYVGRYDAPNLLFINDGKGQFTEQAQAFGLAVKDASLMPAFCDYDRDGDLDLYLVTYRYYSPTGRPKGVQSHIVNGKRVVTPEFEKLYTLIPGNPLNPGSWEYNEIGRPDYFFRNNGDGTFTDVSDEVGISREPGFGNSASWWDYNSDGWPDLYVGNDFQDPDFLYENQGDGTFKNVLREATPHTPWYSMGAAAGDLNNDGHEDFMVVDMAATSHYMSKTTMGEMSTFKEFLDTEEPRQMMRNAVFLATGTPHLMEAGNLTGLGSSDWSWAVKLGDFDLDGWQDVFVSNGMVRNFNNSDLALEGRNVLVGRTVWDLFKDKEPRKERNKAFRNEGGGTHFEKVGKAWGLDHLGMSYSTAVSDLDRDGDLDLIVSHLDEHVELYRNDSQGGRRLLVALKGEGANTHAVGARVQVAAPGWSATQQLFPQEGFNSSDDPVLCIPLGTAGPVALKVSWPSGRETLLNGVEAGTWIQVTEQKGSKPPLAPAGIAPNPRGLFAASSALSFAKHRERAFDDFAFQPLLPNKVSQAGPGVAFGDVDGDGDDDFYLAGAAGQPGELHLNKGEDGFRWKSIKAFRAHRASEGVGALFLDVDGDGDQDLYVANGSYEHRDNPELQQDRLYLNDGTGGFTEAEAGTLPVDRLAGSCVAAADVDRDGDLDVFVGSRVVPGAYPQAAPSRLLINEGGKFRDGTPVRAPALASAGLVTGAVWSDVDGDGWIDLAMTLEWGPVRVFRNVEGKLHEVTREVGLADRLGWWNGIAAGDIDHDGDVDFVVTNFGRNLKYKASAEKPAVLYYGDFEGTGRRTLVEAKISGKHMLPVRGLSCSSSCMPFVRKKFPTFHDFASADLDAIYTPEKLASALRLEANTLETGVLINEGGKLSFKELPDIVQCSPSFGCILRDVNADGHLDILLAQNFYGAQRETPRMGGGLGLVILGDGKGGWSPLPPGLSNFIVREDATALVSTDFTEDGWPDFVVGRNNEQVLGFAMQPARGPRPLVVELNGKPGNPTAVGATVQLHASGQPPQWGQVTAGEGYLSQSSARVHFTLVPGALPEKLVIRWPGGETVEKPIHSKNRHIRIRNE